MPNYPESIPEAYAADQALSDAYRSGWHHGHGLACHNVPVIGESYWLDDGKAIVDAENVREVHSSLCHAAADHSRCYSPFEFIASDFNSAGEFRRDDLWAAFEQGTADAIASDLATYTDEDYGIEPDESSDDLREVLGALAEVIRATDAFKATPVEPDAAWRSAEAQYRAAFTDARAVLAKHRKA